MYLFRLSTCVLAVLAVLFVTGCVDPADQRPGLRLSGGVVETPVADWSFTDAHSEIWIETRTSYLLPHSVTIVCAAGDGKFYVGARDPEHKRWVGNVERDPNVRLQIGERIYEVRLAPLEGDAAEVAYLAYAAKYDREILPFNKRPNVRYWEVVERL
jgi:hypothetical protein